MNANGFTLHRTFPATLVALTLLTFGMAPAASGADYEVAIAAKITAIKWKQADLLAAQREVAILSEFLNNYDAKTSELNNACQQLAGADTQLASIQQDNLVKLTIRMGIETYSTISDTISLGQTAAGALVTNGLTSAVGAVAMDQLTGGLSNEAKAALGLDAATLGGPRTVKIKAVSDAARAAYPDLARVQQKLAMSLEAVKIAVRMNEGTELGDTGALLRKNLMVRDEIAAALAKLNNLGTETAVAKIDAETRLPEAQADVERIAAELAALKTELDNLKAQWRESEAEAQLAANLKALVPPVHQPILPDSVPPIDNETPEEHEARLAAAIVAAAQARWDAEAPAILTAIANSKSDIEAVQNDINTAMSTYINGPEVVSFVNGFVGSDKVDANTTASYEGSVGAYAAIEQRVNAVAPVESALPGMITKVETLTDLYTTLFNLQNQLSSLQQLLTDSGAPTPASYGPAMVVPGMGQSSAEDLLVSLDQYLTQLPIALANARAMLGKLAAAIEAWSGGIGPVSADLEANLAAAQAALAALIDQGAAWEALLAASPGLALDFAHGPQESRLGYFSGDAFTPVVRHAFDLSTYKASLLTAVATPGASGVAAARELRARFDALVAATPAIKDAYDAAWQRYQSAYARVKAYAGPYHDFPVYQDWTRAAAYTSDAHPVDASVVTDQPDHFQSLFYTSNNGYDSSLTGGAPVIGQPVLYWRGLPKMGQLPDPGLDKPDEYLPHRLAALKAVIVEEGPTWISLAPAAFDTNYVNVLNQLEAIRDDADSASDDASKTTSNALFSELTTLSNAYVAAHPKGSITVQPAGSVKEIPAGTTYSAQLSVTATGDFLTYQWSMTQGTDEIYGWQEIAGATSDKLTTPALSETRWFRVAITNPGGTVTSDAARVEIRQVYPAPVFTSTATAFARVGVPFSWTFTTNPSGWISMGQTATLPPGIMFKYMNGKLEGTPTAEGTWDIEITANNQGTLGYQTFRLTVVPQDSEKGDIDNNGSVTLADAILALQVVSGVTPATPVSKWGDVNGDGNIGMAELIYILQKVVEIR